MGPPSPSPSRKTRRWGRRRTVTIFISIGVVGLYVLILVMLHMASITNPINIVDVPSAYYASMRGLVMVQVDLSTAKTVLQVPCNVETKSMMSLDYTSPLVDAIPRYTFHIIIQTPADCQGDEGERSVGIEKLQSFLQHMFPLSDVHHEIMTAGLFPSIALRSADPPTDSLFTAHVPLVKASSLPSGTAKTNCNTIRGRVGKWTYNSTYAKSSWYIPANGGQTGWIRNDELTNGPYKHSSWMWESEQASCPVHLITFRGFCQATDALSITRIFVLGDSIEFMRLVSFFHTMGLVSHVHHHLHGSEGGNLRYSYRFDCTSVGSSMPVDLVFHRVNHLMPILLGGSNATNLQRIDREYIHFICYGKSSRVYPDANGWCPWVHDYYDYSENPEERTLLVGGVGPHFQSVATFREQLQNFVSLLKLHPRPNDIVWLRTVLTGHENCTDEKIPVDPLSNFREFRAKYHGGKETDRWYGWNLFDNYNQCMEAEVIKIGRDKSWNGPKVELFDIYWMSALRRDGHPSSTDCLHYLLPGPPDWWNHLFYSNLRELANL